MSIRGASYYNSRNFVPVENNDQPPVIIQLLPLHYLPPEHHPPLPPPPTAMPAGQVSNGVTNNGVSYTSATQAPSQQVVQAAVYHPSPLAVSFVTHYVATLSLTLGAWIVYLFLPKGARKAYCRASRRRFRRVTQTANLDSVSVSSVADSVLQEVEGKRRFDQERKQQQMLQGYHRARQEAVNAASPSRTSQYKDIPEPPPQDRASAPLFLSTISSPSHPSIMQVPDSTIMDETRRRLKDRGVRLVAHGVHSEPKRVWIRLNGDDDQLEWRTEFPKRITNQVGMSSIVLMRGAPHNIPLPNIVYVDVGKRTAALQKQTGVADTLCFSLLTQSGSLDLQTNSRLERDALVSCLSEELDRVHNGGDWRALYQQSSEANFAPSQVTSGGFLSEIESDNFPNMSTADI
ncbi:hypothetical protein FisN_16Lh229 [Fistulifera solaris]|uniref:Uncharacterized protein n=1 Tax=Fistulifera solaris TaxID=1519565 RepID=A0A1Z5J6H9_FISSO|nr:hypothetical protein FisN_16Lh229 [Fistulifera solaris]|eukprot:GAX09536.1 hypothetical protein FisN_16Lh229 [Fistulifera solaris]